MTLLEELDNWARGLPENQRSIKIPLWVKIFLPLMPPVAFFLVSFDLGIALYFGGVGVLMICFLISCWRQNGKCRT